MDAKQASEPKPAEPAAECHHIQLRGNRPVKIPGTEIQIVGAPKNGRPWVLVKVPLLTNDSEPE